MTTTHDFTCVLDEKFTLHCLADLSPSTATAATSENKEHSVRHAGVNALQEGTSLPANIGGEEA